VVILYTLFIRLYILGIRGAGLWNKKAREWTRGRKNLWQELRSKISKSDRVIWVHCASAGELEQGKPIIEELKNRFPSHKILVSVFSPSGFAVALKYGQADIVTYLPADTRRNAKLFLQAVHPDLVIFVKYEFWYHHLSAVAFRHIPILLVSAIFRKDQAFFSWYGKFYRRILFLFRQIFVQDLVSIEILKAHGILHCSLGGDTRFDRVKKIADESEALPLIEAFAGEEKIVVAGSTWHEDEQLFAGPDGYGSAKLILVPHEIDEAHLEKLRKLFPGSIRYSSLLFDPDQRARVLVIDNIGMLSRLYRYATVAYIGGGFNKSGIHNTIEAAVYGKPVLFGPNYGKFREARDLVAEGGAWSVSSPAELTTKLNELLNDQERLEKAGKAAKNYVESNGGATGKIVRYIQENRLLTN
jgi:3-deoxy-D-manno-octulosonic-acid transferase